MPVIQLRTSVIHRHEPSKLCMRKAKHYTREKQSAWTCGEMKVDMSIDTDVNVTATAGRRLQSENDTASKVGVYFIS